MAMQDWGRQQIAQQEQWNVGREQRVNRYVATLERLADMRAEQDRMWEKWKFEQERAHGVEVEKLRQAGRMQERGAETAAGKELATFKQELDFKGLAEWQKSFGAPAVKALGLDTLIPGYVPSTPEELQGLIRVKIAKDEGQDELPAWLALEPRLKELGVKDEDTAKAMLVQLRQGDIAKERQKEQEIETKGLARIAEIVGKKPEDFEGLTASQALAFADVMGWTPKAQERMRATGVKERLAARAELRRTLASEWKSLTKNEQGRFGGYKKFAASRMSAFENEQKTPEEAYEGWLNSSVQQQVALKTAAQNGDPTAIALLEKIKKGRDLVEGGS